MKLLDAKVTNQGVGANLVIKTVKNVWMMLQKLHNVPNAKKAFICLKLPTINVLRNVELNVILILIQEHAYVVMKDVQIVLAQV